ncbi:MAG: hypothetical protein EBV05_00835 [Cyanobacteria bacterium WB6_1B_304]|nr:hypothetical protein [Cyanobacteria bacterium WB6_1B_304]
MCAVALYRCLYSLTIHVVLVTKYRKEIIDKAILQRLQEIVPNTCEQWGSTLKSQFYSPHPNPLPFWEREFESGYPLPFLGEGVRG